MAAGGSRRVCCGPLNYFDHSAKEDKAGYKTDKTSLYPASSTEIEFETEDGVQRPLEQWYRGFPDPTIGKTTGLGGWCAFDYEGSQLGQEEYDELSEMHGLIKIRFAQSHLAFPFFLLHAEHQGCNTIAPFMTRTEYFIIPHVRMAWGYNVKIELHDCQYTLGWCEPFKKVHDDV